MSGLSFLDAALAELERQDLLRSTRRREELPAGAVLLCSNDYLGFGARTPRALVEPTPGGAGASALVWGYGEVHAQAERALAAFLEGADFVRSAGGSGARAVGTRNTGSALSALMFSSGYAANVGTIAALAGRGDRIVSDALNHASLIDGCRLSGADVAVVRHLDLAAMDEALAAASGARRRFVVTESCFSMDGDGPDLRELRAVCDRRDAVLMIDEAHAIGVMGPEGRGRAAAEGVRPDVLVGTLGKAFGLAGAFVVGSAALRQWLWNRARSFVFSTAPLPTLAAAVPSRVAEVHEADDLRLALLTLERRFRARLEELGRPQPGEGPIVPVQIGKASDALRVSAALLDQGFVVQAIRPPTVPPGTSRLRVTLRADLEPATVEAAAEAISRALDDLEDGPESVSRGT